MKHTLFTTFFLFATMATLLTGCNNRKPQSTSTSGMASVVCDESVESIVGEEVELFCFSYPDAHITPCYVDETAAVDSLSNGKTSLIITTQLLNNELKDSIAKVDNRVFSQLIAIDAVAIAVNTENSIQELTVGDLKDILSETAKQWKDVEPSKLNDIKIVTAKQNTSILKYLSDTLLNKDEIAAKIVVKDNAAEVVNFIAADKDAMGILSVKDVLAKTPWSMMDKAQKSKALQQNDTTALTFNTAIKVLKIRKDDQLESYQPYQAYLYDGQYPLCRNIYAISTAPLGSLSSGFLSYITGISGQKIIQNAGLFPGAIQPRIVKE